MPGPSGVTSGPASPPAVQLPLPVAHSPVSVLPFAQPAEAGLRGGRPGPGLPGPCSRCACLLGAAGRGEGSHGKVPPVGAQREQLQLLLLPHPGGGGSAGHALGSGALWALRGSRLGRRLTRGPEVCGRVGGGTGEGRADPGGRPVGQTASKRSRSQDSERTVAQRHRPGQVWDRGMGLGGRMLRLGSVPGWHKTGLASW